MNIDFVNEKYRFNARSSAIIYNTNKTKVLLFNVGDNRDFYMLPGGRIMHFENSKDAIKREIKEELGWLLEYDFCCIQENFLESKVQYWQQLAYAERQHSYELEQILKKLEKKIYGLEKEDK